MEPGFWVQISYLQLGFFSELVSFRHLILFTEFSNITRRVNYSILGHSEVYRCSSAEVFPGYFEGARSTPEHSRRSPEHFGAHPTPSPRRSTDHPRISQRLLKIVDLRAHAILLTIKNYLLLTRCSVGLPLPITH